MIGIDVARGPAPTMAVQIPGGVRGAADVLCLAAAPTFALMALLTGVLGGGPLDALCAAAHGASPPGGMVVMYGLMSAFHGAPWLRLLAGRRPDACRS